MTIASVRLNDRDVRPHKAAASPLLDARTVLTKSPWEFVSLWLKKQKKEEALFHWTQARQFADASVGLPVHSAPLLHYYCFMNAAKALLVAKGVTFDPYHGVKGVPIGGKATKKISLSNTGVKIKPKGVVPALATYMADAEPATTHSLKEVLFNIPYVHRTYCLTYRSQKDLFYALTDCAYVIDSSTGDAFLRAYLSRDFAHKRYHKRLPSTFVPDAAVADVRAVRSHASVKLASGTLKTPGDIGSIGALNRQLRRDLHYIAGAQTLWYVKGVVPGPKRLERSPLTLTLAAMHHLSEICRYRPLELAALLAGPHNWLISEFVLMAPEQYLDGIASEITGHQFLLPNVRSAV